MPSTVQVGFAIAFPRARGMFQPRGCIWKDDAFVCALTGLPKFLPRTSIDF